jgi:hypothetical protein
MKKFENLGKSLSKEQQKKIGGGQTCYTKCPSTGGTWGLECSGDCAGSLQGFPGVIRCNGKFYTWGCAGTHAW